MKTIDVVNAELSSDKVEIKRLRYKFMFRDANYLVRLRTWYGWTHIGHFRTIKDAAAAARKTAAATRNK